MRFPMRLVRSLTLAAVLVLAGGAWLVRAGGPAAQAPQPAPTVPPGVIPGAPAGSPEQKPDPSGFDFTTLFHDLQPDDTSGFVQIFDGGTLDGWAGDPQFWRVEGGAIVAESTPDRVVKQNTFLIWRGDTLRDFELKIDFRVIGGNSGVQVRSTELPAVGPWVLKGYQADFDSANGFTGNIHEERGRQVLAPRGQIVRAVDGPVFKSIGTIADSADLRGLMNIDNWNRYHIIGRGPLLMQVLNGRLVAVLIDEDTTHRALEGVLGLQMHTGPPFRVEFRNIWYRKL